MEGDQFCRAKQRRRPKFSLFYKRLRRLQEGISYVSHVTAYLDACRRADNTTKFIPMDYPKVIEQLSV